MILRQWHAMKMTAFCGLSTLDLFCTYRLIQLSGGQVYESNPIAHAWLALGGWMGLAFFKIVMVFIVIACSLYVGQSRPRAAGGILVFACLAVAFVVGYSYKLGGSNDLLCNTIAGKEKNLLITQEAPTLNGIYLVPDRESLNR